MNVTVTCVMLEVHKFMVIMKYSVLSFSRTVVTYKHVFNTSI